MEKIDELKIKGYNLTKERDFAIAQVEKWKEQIIRLNKAINEIYLEEGKLAQKGKEKK